jgi:hypothetical protein
MAMAMEMAMDDLHWQGYRVSARTLRDRGADAPEREFGADFVTVFEVVTPEVTLRKGFLAQAKMAGKAEVSLSGGPERPSIMARVPVRQNPEPSDLAPQCGTMLAVSPSSYVFIYSDRGISVVPATAITSLNPGGSPVRLHAEPLTTFFSQFFRCFVGDQRLSAYDDATLRAVREQTAARAALLLSLTSTRVAGQQG